MCKLESFCDKCNSYSLEFVSSDWDDYGKKWAYYVCENCGEEYWCDYYYGFD